jgi:hypothetical protein
MIRELRALLALSQDFVIVGQNPIFAEMNSDPGISLIEKFFGVKKTENDDVEFKTILKESRIADVSIRNWADDANIRYIDSYNILCPKDPCVRRFNGKPLYIDSNHLSGFGAVMLKNEFDKILDQRIESLE